MKFEIWKKLSGLQARETETEMQMLNLCISFRIIIRISCILSYYIINNIYFE